VQCNLFEIFLYPNDRFGVTHSTCLQEEDNLNELIFVPVTFRFSFHILSGKHPWFADGGNGLQIPRDADNRHEVVLQGGECMGTNINSYKNFDRKT